MNVPAPIGVVGDYNLLERLEPAGPGELFRARDTRKGRTVVVRLLPPGFAPDEGSRRRFVEQARSMGVLSHPNVIALFDAGEHEDRTYVVFEFITGQSLRAEMAGRPMNVRRAVELAVQMADAVADAHAADFVHRGLSPDSVIVTAKGHAKIPAFELAARGGFEAGGDRLRDYDSPEEAKGQQADDRSDIYSIGAILYEMLTTHRPSHKGAAAPSASNRHVILDLDDIVLRAVAPKPDARYQSAVTLAAELRSVAARFDVRETAIDEEAEAGRSTSVARGLVTSIVLTGVLAVLWWIFMR